MKSYSEYMNELSPSDVFDGLLGHGLFAEKIPPVLTSEDFCTYYKGEVAKGKKPCPDTKWCDYIRYESMRNVCIPRPISIPNPFAYADLCLSIERHWPDIQSYFSSVTANQKHKNSRIHVRKLKGNSSIFEMSYKNFTYDGSPQDDFVKFCKYKVSADISSCFPSIYSHAIPWAVKGKAASKASKAHWSDEIDEKCRNIKFGETSGMLIGPHASNIISEIILSKIDEALVDEGFLYFRCIDDYTCYCSSMEEAERFIASLNRLLKEYELSINHKKTCITSLPETSETDWVIRLNSVYLGNVYTEDGTKQVLPLSILKIYLDTAVRATAEGKDAAPLNYAIKVISSKCLGSMARQYYINRLMHLVYSYPYLVSLMQEFVFKPFNVSSSDIVEFANAMYKYGFDHETYEASSYALFWAIENDVPVNVKTEDEVFKTRDCVFMLLSYIYSEQKKMGADVLSNYEAEAKSLMRLDMDRYWLFVYEVLPETKLRGVFNGIKKKGVSFIKEEVRSMI